MAGTERNDQNINRIKLRGLRVTQPRRVILAELDKASEYITAEDIYHKIHPGHPRIGLATVYRTLTLLTEIGVVTKFDFGDGKSRYELTDVETNEKHHHVLVCERCYKVIKYSDFTPKEKKNFDQLENTLKGQFDFDIHRHVVHYYGVCADCRSKA